MKNNLTDEKIIKMIKKDYKTVKPSSRLRERIKNSDQDVYNPKNNIKYNIIINLMQMLKSNKLGAVIGVVALFLLVGGGAIYLNKNKVGDLGLDNLSMATKNMEQTDREINEIIDDAAEVDEDLKLVAQGDENSSSDLSETDLDDLDDSLKDLDEIDDILDEEVFDDSFNF